MKIQYFGHSCFILTSNSGTSVITDPFTRVGYELPKGLVADVATISHAHFDHNYTQAIACEKIVNEVGVFYFNDVEILGVHSYHDSQKGVLRGENVIFKIKMDGLTFCHLGDLGEECNAELIAKIGHVDVLLIPVGGTYTIDAPQAMKYIESLRPILTIPMHYKPVDGSLDITGVEPFLGLCSLQNIEHIVGSMDLDISKHVKPILYMERMK